MTTSPLSAFSPVARPAVHKKAVSEHSSDNVRLILQSPYADDLDRVRIGFFAEQNAGGSHIKAELPLVEGMAVQVERQHLDSLMRLVGSCREVRVTPDAPIFIAEPVAGPVAKEPSPLAEVSVPATRANELWQQGITGKGVGIAVLDTGIAPHPDVRDRIVHFQDMVNNRNDGPYDDHGHGTHVASLAAGDGQASNGRITGTAPEASLVGVKVLDNRGEGRFSDIIKGIQWAVENRERFNLKVLNLSLGAQATRSHRDDPVAQALQAAWEKGLVPVVAAGNGGPFTRTINTPAHTPIAITVGASDHEETVPIDDDRVASFSARGPTHPDGLVKPDVVAPGVRINGADPQGGYIARSGTSMSAPLVSGIVAQLVQSRPQSTPAEIKSALMDTGRHLSDGTGETVQGRGLVDAVAAVERLRESPQEAEGSSGGRAAAG